VVIVRKYMSKGPRLRWGGFVGKMALEFLTEHAAQI
jgi:hypothetical protein